MALTTWDEQSLYLDYEKSIAANGARTGRSLHRVVSKGAGETHLAQPIDFRLTFVEKPVFTSGLSLLSGQLISGAYPIATVGVYKWRTDNRNFYIGAYLWVAVSYAPTSLNPAYAQVVSYEEELALAQQAVAQALALNALQLEHHLCFEGMAIRDVNYDEIVASP